MTSTAASLYATWHTDPQREVAMADSHAPLWRHFIEAVPERDFSTKTILDVGCNRGGFLRLLHTLRPFHFGVGVDIASDSIAAATATKGDLPLQFEVATDLARWKSTFDIAFSYEVIYLLPNLARHASDVFDALRDGGTYYAVTGCHTESPLWPKWRELIGATTSAPVQDYAPQDFIDAFSGAGFDVSVKRLGFEGFIPASKDRSYYPSILDAISYYSEHKLLFRLDKRI